MRILKIAFSIALFLLLPSLAPAQEDGQNFLKKETFTIPGKTYFQSGMIHTDIEFDTFAAEGLTAGQLLTVYIDTKPFKIFPDDEGVDQRFSELIFHDPTLYFRFVIDNRSALPQNITFHLINSRAEANLEKSNLFAATSLGGLRIISRSGWGANESLRYYNTETKRTPASTEKKSTGISQKVLACNKLIEKYPNEFKYTKVVTKSRSNKYYKWPLQYSPRIYKLVIHHTAETSVNKNRDPRQVMRAIYYYHNITRGWGDIGYNFVIDREGKIYEGRSGGDFVVGGHAYCHNVGTIGISLMGNFQNESPTKAQIQALTNLGKVLTKKYGLHPEAKDRFHGDQKPNILGHRDVGSTACPGNNLYMLLPYLRKSIVSNSSYRPVLNEKKELNSKFAAIVKSNVDIIQMNPTESKKNLISFKNTGKQTWKKDTWLFVFGNPQDHVETVTKQKNYVAADLWESSVAPGKIGTFEVEIQSGYKEGFYTFEYTPVINGKYKLNTASIVQPVAVNKAKLSYKFVRVKKPERNLFYGKKFEAWVELKNTGNVTWSNEEGQWGKNAIQLGADHPRNRESTFNETSPTRIGRMVQKDVPPGKTGRFVFKMEAPRKKGVYREYFTPVIGNEWLRDSRMFFLMYIREPQYKFQLTNKGQKRSIITAGIPAVIQLDIKNTGDLPWTPDEVAFKVINPNSTVKLRAEPDGKELNFIPIKESVKPGETMQMDLHVYATEKSTKINYIKLTPLYKKQKKFKNSIPLMVVVKQPIVRARKVYPTDKIKKIRLDTGESTSVTVHFKNTGNIPWEKDGEGMILLKSTKSKSKLYLGDTWMNINTIGTFREKSVKPGETASFKFNIGSNVRGFFRESFQLWKKGKGYIGGTPFTVQATVIGKRSGSLNKNGALNSMKTYKKTKKRDTNAKNIAGSQDMRVLLSFFPTEAIIGGNGVFDVTDGDGKIIFGNVKEDIKVQAADYKNLESSGGKSSTVMRFIPGNNTILQIKNWEHRPAWNRKLNDNEYRGILELRIENGKIIIINELPLEDYMKGVAEVPNGEPYEKQKAMAILARTYALFYLQPGNEKFPGKSYHGSDDPDVFQKYLGYGYESRSPNFIKAVLATRGKVVTYLDNLVKTPYFSQSDGRTRSAEEVWGWTHTPYLKSVPDPYCKGLTRLGHGVGLSGYGARKMAENGKGYEEIIKYYYRDVDIKDRL